MRKRSLGRQVLLIAGFGLIVAVGMFGLLAVTIRSLEKATEEARNHERVATNAHKVGALVVDAETAVRGYLITGREPFLQPLENAQREMPLVTSRLRRDAVAGEEARGADAVASRATDYLDDYIANQLDVARTSRAEANEIVAGGEGKRRVDEIRREITGLVSIAGAAAADRQELAASRGNAARIGTVVAAFVLTGVLLALLRAMSVLVVRPVSEIVDVAGRIGSGDLAARLPVRRGDEIGQLSAAINEMASQLQDTSVELEAQQTELESQNAELETQSVELETQAAELERRGVELAASNDLLRERTAEIEETSEELRKTNAQVELYARVSDSLARVPDVVGRAAVLLAEIADVAGCPIGLIYAKTAQSGDALTLVCSRGIDQPPAAADLAGTFVARAMAERRPIVATHAEASLEVDSLGVRTTVRHELHLPMSAGIDRDLLLGVVSLARTDDRPFSDEDLALLTHLVDNAGLAFFNALVSTQREQQAAMMRAVLNSVSEAILVVSATGEVVICNPPMDAFARRLMSIGPDAPWDIPGLRVAMEREVRDREAHDEVAARLAADALATDHQTVELPRLAMWIDRYAAPVQSADDELLGRIVVVRDITDERQAERAKDDLMATVSHELRTPLAAILGFTELLVTREFSDAERGEYLDTVYQQSVRLSDLLDDFLDLQRIERRGLDHRSAVDVRELVGDQVNLYSAQSESHELAATVPGHALLVEADGERLRRVIGNLLSNAIKYSPDGGRVEIDAARVDGMVRVQVTDRGIGIPQELRTRVFDRFFRVDSGASARIGGTGLGLALVRDIIAAHGGDVGVESVEGQGSKFWFTLPAAG